MAILVVKREAHPSLVIVELFFYIQRATFKSETIEMHCCKVFRKVNLFLHVSNQMNKTSLGNFLSIRLETTIV